MNLDGKVALVTGASRGLGRATALRLAREGAAVALNYRERSAGAESAVAEIRSAGGRAVSVQADIGDPAQVLAMIERTASELGPVDILVNNAGVAVTGDLSDFDFS